MPAIDMSQDRYVSEVRLLKLHGSTNQRERWEARLLPEDELLTLARTVLFAPFSAFRRWQKLLVQDVKHDRSCSGGTVVFRTRAPEDLAPEEWATYKAIGSAVHAQHELFASYGAHFLVELIEHVGHCTVCPAEVFGRAASIRLEWAGRHLSREYTLEVA